MGFWVFFFEVAVRIYCSAFYTGQYFIVHCLPKALSLYLEYLDAATEEDEI